MAIFCLFCARIILIGSNGRKRDPVSRLHTGRARLHSAMLVCQARADFESGHSAEIKTTTVVRPRDCCWLVRFETLLKRGPGRHGKMECSGNPSLKDAMPLHNLCSMLLKSLTILFQPGTSIGSFARKPFLLIPNAFTSGPMLHRKGPRK
jgi:hypothetical protein